MMTVPHKMVRLERMSNNRGVELEWFHFDAFELSMLQYGDCSSYDCQIRENVRLERFYCNAFELLSKHFYSVQSKETSHTVQL